MMPKVNELTSDDVYEIFRYLTVAGHNILYAITLLSERCEKELAADHHQDDLEMELNLLRSEFDYYLYESSSRTKPLKRSHH